MTTPEPTVAEVRNVDAGHYRNLLCDAARVVIGRQVVNQDTIQRRVRVGFVMAGRLLILLEDRGHRPDLDWWLPEGARGIRPAGRRPRPTR